MRPICNSPPGLTVSCRRIGYSKSASSVGSPSLPCPVSSASLHRRNAQKSSFVPLSAPSISPALSNTSTVILFLVKVPVLSEQTTLTAPNVSTDGRRRMMVFTLAIRETESARTIVTTAGSPSGTAATAREITVINISPISLSCQTAAPNKTAHSATARRLKTPPRSPRRFCRGVASSGASWMSVAILPISVSMPVAVTRPAPRPAVTFVDI